ncbi:ABC transporter permease [Nocardioides agariphilus]|jgi:peptide/nickel transport system permease protein|uniref:ABC transporter permease n=1 Tax=Nocardioides agariphilus TaxID=433664 RepID=A0A930VSH7_9ACTN|nr:ABC transporter permease [Nocardioides agariphilus]MBF4770183.1 ABC transporter permease [Nocardioides agariphilus]
MFGYIVRRLIAGVLVLIAVSMMVFAIFFYGPNDPALAYCPESRCTPQRLDNLRHNLGLDRPAPQQYVEYMSGLVKSRHIESGGISIDCNWPCLGVSFKYRVSVFHYLWDRFPATFSVAAGGAICFLIIGLFSGIFAARRRGTMADKAIVSTSLFINAIPYYLLALLAYLYLVQGLGLFPETGYHSPFKDGPFKFVGGLALPWLMLGIAYSTQYARFSRGAMVDALNEDYVRTARAKGLMERVVVRRHALRAAIVPVVTIFGLDFAYLLAGTLFTEKIFGIQGMGLAGLDAVQRTDLPMISAYTLISAAFIVVANIVVDILYSVIDPRVRLA